MNKNSNSKFNRINYIVQENPLGVSQTLVSEGIIPSQEMNQLVIQTKDWINKVGKTAIVKLLKVHPEKDAIISANMPEFQNFDGCGCGGKSSFDGTQCPCQAKSSYTKDFNEDLVKMTNKELQEHYKELKRLLQQFPEDEELRQEIETVWGFIGLKQNAEMSNRVNQNNSFGKGVESKTVFSVSSKDLAIGSFIFGLAIIISQVK